MAITKNDELKVSRRYELADPATFVEFEEWAMWLEAILHGPCYIFTRDNGEELLALGKQLVERLNGLRIEIYQDEHPPPHFHLKSPNVDASFAIDDCRLLKGRATPDAIKRIRYWHRRSKAKLIEIWNSTRPTDCVVGKYQAD